MSIVEKELEPAVGAGASGVLMNGLRRQLQTLAAILKQTKPLAEEHFQEHQKDKCHESHNGRCLQTIQ